MGARRTRPRFLLWAALAGLISGAVFLAAAELAALIAARSDFAGQLRRVSFRVQDFVGVMLYRSLVLRVRAMMTVGRLLDSWKDGQKQRRGLADPQR